MRYGGALLSVGAAVAVWTLTGLMHRDPFAIFVLAVVAIARFLGFGPAVFGTALSVIAIDYIGFEPRFSMGITASDLGRLAIFVIISLLAASLARQKSRAEVRADQTHARVTGVGIISGIPAFAPGFRFVSLLPRLRSPLYIEFRNNPLTANATKKIRQARKEQPPMSSLRPSRPFFANFAAKGFL